MNYSIGRTEYMEAEACLNYQRIKALKPGFLRILYVIM